METITVSYKSVIFSRAVGCINRQKCEPNWAFYHVPADEDKRLRWTGRSQSIREFASIIFLQGDSIIAHIFY